MTKGVFVIPCETGINTENIYASLRQELEGRGLKVGSLCAIGKEPDSVLSSEYARNMSAQGRGKELEHQVMQKAFELGRENDFILCEGSDLSVQDVSFELMGTVKIASSLGFPVIIAIKTRDKHSDEVTKTADAFIDVLMDKKIDIIAAFIGEDGRHMVSEERRGIKFFSEINKDLVDQLLSYSSENISANMFEFKLIDKARKAKKRIVLPEGASERILRAAEQIVRKRIADITLLGSKKEIVSNIKRMGLDLDGVEIINPKEYPKFDEYANTLYELRKGKGMTPEGAVEEMKDISCFGTMMVYKGDADGMVSGAEHTTAHTIRPALQFIKTKAEYSLVSGLFIMCFNNRVYLFADCAVNPNPTPAQLAEIAKCTAEQAKMFGIEPRVAMLSYSTGNSAGGPMVDAVKEAVEEVHKRYPSLKVDGPLQYDAAIDLSVARTKLPDSEVAGRATVFIFPDLNAGNIGYKAAQRAAEGIVAIGPILQGLNKPVNDLSRGATVADIVNTVAITAIQAQATGG